MTRAELIQAIAAKQTQLSFKEAEIAVKYVLDRIATEVASGKRAEIRRFGSFSVRFRAPRIARNPKTGESIQKLGKYSIHFKPGKEMRERVNLMASQYPIQTMESL